MVFDQNCYKPLGSPQFRFCLQPELDIKLAFRNFQVLRDVLDGFQSFWTFSKVERGGKKTLFTFFDQSCDKPLGSPQFRFYLQPELDIKLAFRSFQVLRDVLDGFQSFWTFSKVERDCKKHLPPFSTKVVTNPLVHFNLDSVS